MESMLSVHQSTFSRLGAGILRTRTGRFTEVYPLVVLPCRTGSISLGVVTDEEFDRLTIAMDRPALAGDQRFSSQPARQQHVAELEGILVEWLSHLEAAEAVDLLQAHAVAAATVASAEELLANPQLAHRNFWDWIDGRRAPGNPLLAMASPSVSGGAPRTGPAAGLVVLDLTAFWAGPSATRNLADLGARVIRVERPGTRVDFVEVGDTSAHVARLFDDKMNRGKESIVLDLKAPGGRDAFLRLVEKADVLVENHRADVIPSLGLGWEVLHEANPRLVYVALSGFGASGPWSRRRSYGPTIEAASSIEDRTRYPGSAPLRLGHTLPDGVGGLAGTLAALVGLRRRQEQGCGSYFDISQLEAYCVLSGEELLAMTPDSRSFGVLPCRGEDEWVAVGVPPDPSLTCSTARRTKWDAARQL
jgi:crotonobetainyl-CoA:carnitine CoA-transferase CaiB-like acyl-CoA transferase